MLSPSSPEWQETKTFILERIEQLRVQLEVVGLAPDETNALRGRIAELRDFVAEVDPPKGLATEAPANYT